MNRYKRALAGLFVFAALFGVFTGCGDKDLSQIVENVSNQVEQASSQVKDAVSKQAGEAQEQLGLSGQFTLDVNGPIQTAACYAIVTPGESNRPALLQLRSYRDIEQESFPSAFLQAELSGNTLDAMNGKTVSARLFVQTEQGGPVWSTARNARVELRIASVSDTKLQVEIVAGELFDSVTEKNTPVTGVATAVILQP